MIYLGYFLLAVLAVLLLLIFVPFNLHIIYLKDVSVYLRWLFVRIKLFPGTKNKEKEKKDKKEKKKETESKPQKKNQKRSLKENLTLVKNILTGLKKPAKKLFKSIKIDNLKAEIKFATDDCAKTAKNFSYVSALYGSLINLAGEIFTLKEKERYIYPDFASEKTEIYMEASVKMNVFSLLLFLAVSFRAEGENIRKLINK